MCFGESNADRDIELPARQTTSTARTHTARPPTSRQQSSQHRPASRQTHSRVQTSSRPGGSSSRSGRSSHGRREHERPRTHTHLAPVEEQPPTDDEIQHDLYTLNMLIDQHAQNFYRPHDAVFVRREIGKDVIDRIIKNDNV